MRLLLPQRLLPVLLVLAHILPAHAALYRVGAMSDANCTYQTIQDAIDAAGADPNTYDLIYVASNQSYGAQALSIDHQSVGIYGGFADCLENSASGTVTIVDGSGNGGVPVLDLNLIGGGGYLVSLVNLELRNGNVASGDGGNLRVRGEGQVGLSGLLMRNGTAARGGGLYAAGDDSNHKLNLQIGSSSIAPTTVEGNDATTDGGGIYCDQYCFLGISSVRVADNDAQRGGGVFMAGQASMSFSAGGTVHGVATGILLNRASLDGGGLYGDTGSSPSSAWYFAPNYPPQIAGNQAGRDGGGIFLTGAGTFLLGYNLHLDDNIAGTAQTGRGGGLFLSGGASALISEDNDSLHCGLEIPCVALTGNIAGYLGQSGSGGGVYVDAGSSLSISYAMFEGNAATDGAAADVSGNAAQLTLRNAILTANEAPHSVLVEANGHVDLIGVTIADELSSESILKVNFATMNIDTAIIHDPGTPVVTLVAPTTLTTNCVLSHEDFDIAGDVRVGDPDFVNAASRDFHLGENSDALDACAIGPFAVGASDYSESRRGVDLPGVIDLGGPFDLGAYEKQLPPEVFLDGFEGS